MDGFKERLNARRELNEAMDEINEAMPANRFERPADRPMEARYERPADRYERIPRRDGVSAEAVSEAVNKNNQMQLEVIEEMFDEAQAYRLESEKTIIDVLSEKIEMAKEELVAGVDSAIAQGSGSNSAPVQNAGSAINSDSGAERLVRIELLSQKTREAIEVTSEELDKNYEALNAVRAGISEIRAVQNEMQSSNYEMQQNIQQSIFSLAQQNLEVQHAQAAQAAQAQAQAAQAQAQAAQAQAAQAQVSQPQPQAVYNPSIGSSNEELLNAVNDNRTLLNMIREDILSSQSSQNTYARTDDDMPASAGIEGEAISELMDKHYKDLEEHVHKECVKCYRNVQQALTEQTTASLNKTETSITGVKTIATVSLILNAVTLLGVIAGVIISSGVLNGVLP